MQAVAKLRFARISAQKGRLVADQIRGLPVEQALNVLTFSKKKGAADEEGAGFRYRKCREQRRRRHRRTEGQDGLCDEGPTMKRLRARAKGRGTRILKRTSHITVTVADE